MSGNLRWHRSASGLAPRVSHGDELDVDTSGLGQAAQITGVGGQDLVAVTRKADKSGIDRICTPASPQEHSSSLAQGIIQRLDVDPGK